MEGVPLRELEKCQVVILTKKILIARAEYTILTSKFNNQILKENNE